MTTLQAFFYSSKPKNITNNYTFDTFSLTNMDATRPSFPNTVTTAVCSTLDRSQRVKDQPVIRDQCSYPDLAFTVALCLNWFLLFSVSPMLTLNVHLCHSGICQTISAVTYFSNFHAHSATISTVIQSNMKSGSFYRSHLTDFKQICVRQQFSVQHVSSSSAGLGWHTLSLWHTEKHPVRWHSWCNIWVYTGTLCVYLCVSMWHNNKAVCHLLLSKLQWQMMNYGYTSEPVMKGVKSQVHTQKLRGNLTLTFWGSP